ncbi:MAG: DUF1707 domain-containing protein [Solirubrobacteraceae bacterium]
MTRRSALRASDVDRERVAEHLRLATVDGRIETDELEERLEAAFSARTYRQLGAVVSDLPASGEYGDGLPVWARASLGVAGSVGVLAAAAAASVIFAGIAGASVAWTLFGRVLFGRGRGVGLPAGRSMAARNTWLPPCPPPPRALASRHAETVDAPRLRRRSRARG